MIYSFNYCSFLKERSTLFNADSTVTTVKIAEIISRIKKKEACVLMRQKNSRDLFFDHRSRRMAGGFHAVT